MVMISNIIDTIIYFLIGIIIVRYFLMVIPRYLIAKKANLRNPELMFVPIVGDIKMLNLANISGWAILLVLIPFVYIILVIVRNFKIYTQFDFSDAGRIVGLFFTFIVFWFIALDNKTDFKGRIEEKYM